MKGKLFIGMAISLLSIGAAAGFVGTKHVIETKAESEIASVYLKGSFDGWKGGKAFTLNEGVYTLEQRLEVDTKFKIFVENVSDHNNDKWVGHNWEDFTNWPSEYLGNDGEDFKVTKAATFIFTVNDNFFTNDVGYGKAVSISVKRYNVTQYAVKDGEKEETPLKTEKIDAGANYAIPDSLSIIGYNFGGWYKDLGCTQAYAAAEVNADIDLFAKLTCTQDKYIYYVSQSNADTPNYIYTFKENLPGEFGAWPGTKITEIPNVEEVHGVLRFQGIDQKIYKIPFTSSLADSKIILNAGQGQDQTGDMELTAGAAYKFSGGKSTAGGPDADGGAALDFLLKAERIRNGATYQTHPYSVCGISKEDAKELVSEYAAFTDEVKEEYINCSYTYTYKDATFEAEDSWSYAQIMRQLGEIATTPDGILSIDGMKGDQAVTTIAITIIAAVVVVGFISFIAIRKKKTNI